MGEIEEKKSRFIATVEPIEKEEDAKKARELLREKNCFVFLTRPWC